MFEVHLACSDCPEEIDVLVDELDELAGLECECGYGLATLAIGEVEVETALARVITISRREGGGLSLAA